MMTQIEQLNQDDYDLDMQLHVQRSCDDGGSKKSDCKQAVDCESRLEIVHVRHAWDLKILEQDKNVEIKIIANSLHRLQPKSHRPNHRKANKRRKSPTPYARKVYTKAP